MYNIIGKEIRVCTFYKEFKDGDKLIATHTKYESLVVENVIDVISDYKEGWAQYTLLMTNGTTLEYFSGKGLT